eukprot:gene5108-5614_t
MKKNCAKCEASNGANAKSPTKATGQVQGQGQGQGKGEKPASASVTLPPVKSTSTAKTASNTPKGAKNAPNGKLPAIAGVKKGKEAETVVTTAPPTANTADDTTKGTEPLPEVSKTEGSQVSPTTDPTSQPLIQESPNEAIPAAVAAATTIPASSSDPSSSAQPAEATPSETPINEPPIPVYKPEEHNGMVKLLYEQYNEDFPIVNGSTTQENVDEVYCLSFVMPNCLIHLSSLNPSEKRARDIDQAYEGMYVEENPRGIYQGLKVSETYYVYVEQEAEQLKRDQEIMRQRAAADASKAQAPLPKDDGRAMESCSCIYGNPCVDEYGCRDWNNRFAVATKNGWKGF